MQQMLTQRKKFPVTSLTHELYDVCSVTLAVLVNFLSCGTREPINQSICMYAALEN